MENYQTSTPIIDLHIHSTIKPYGHSLYGDPIDLRTNSSCVWFSDHRSRRDLLLESVFGICRYRQADFSTLTAGQVKIACVSLYPIEKEFFDIRDGKFLKLFERCVADLAGMFGKKRIMQVQAETFDYFADLNAEYRHLMAMHDSLPPERKYFVLSTAKDLNKLSDLFIVPTIEGCHAFADGNNPALDIAWNNLESNVATVKSWPSPPLFVTFAHHFYNGLCTHARSLYDTAGKVLDQTHGMRDKGWTPTDGLPAISPIGYKMIRSLLGTGNGKRILIDVKHMSLEARLAYYKLLEDEYDNTIPVIWSHGATQEHGEQINLSLKDDVAVIYKTKGIIGIEMDQRILGYNNNRVLRAFVRFFRRRSRYHQDAGYFWNQVITIAEFAYTNGFEQDPWACIALGSDYDGIINPLNMYPDAISLNILYNCLIDHLVAYWDSGNPVIPVNHNGLEATDVIYRIMYKNAYSFLTAHLND